MILLIEKPENINFLIWFNTIKQINQAEQANEVFFEKNQQFIIWSVKVDYSSYFTTISNKTKAKRLLNYSRKKTNWPIISH